MAQEKISFEQFMEGVNANYQGFAMNLHEYLLEKCCKAAFEEKKTGLFGSYKHTKTKKLS